MIAIGNVDLAKNTPYTWQLFDHFNDQNNGYVTISKSDGTILSVDQNGNWSFKPSGTNGWFEQFSVNGQFLAINSTNNRTENQVRVYPFVTLP